MAENCSVLDPWMHRLESAWISEASALETAALTRALQISLFDTTTSSSAAAAAVSADTLASPLLFLHQSTPPSSSSSSSSSSSFSSAAASGGVVLRQANTVGPAAAGRVSKRKSRASRRSATTYITADPANFREMVQQVTGVRLGGVEPAEALVKPKPPRPAVGARAALQQQIRLPTLDTSAFLLDRGGDAAIPREAGSFVAPPVDAPGFDLDALLPAFPTFDSWGML